MKKQKTKEGENTMDEIKTIDKLPRTFLELLAKNLGYKAWDKNLSLRGVTKETSDLTLAKFISASI